MATYEPLQDCMGPFGVSLEITRTDPLFQGFYPPMLGRMRYHGCHGYKKLEASDKIPIPSILEKICLGYVDKLYERLFTSQQCRRFVPHYTFVVHDGTPGYLTNTTVHASRLRAPHGIVALTRCRDFKFRCGRSRFNPQFHAKLPSLHCKEQCYHVGSDIRLDYFIHAIRYTPSPITNVTCYQRQPRRSLLLGLGQRTRSGRRTCLLSRNMSAALCRIVLCRNTKCCTHPAYIAA